MYLSRFCRKDNLIKSMRACSICEKSYKYSITRKKVRSKYNPVGRKKTLANLQWVKLPDGKRVKACANCMRTLAKPKRIKKSSKK